MAEHNKHALISDIAEQAGRTYEDVEPHVIARLETSKPKPA
ncbi:hypothetical protein JAN5088_01901 [Jannaschia rubra]|uniref:Uncharacterized protein n=1 Tax=Jannaschia rubra TaxID=282197 RepID=A0A0M6XSE7_9RHOB|nr:hypothetical protein JAN5088_01901 [Jannaschia rubra]SFG83567.1 hypothetical protein SAMN04488517_12116 [Jannaschia rubra]